MKKINKKDLITYIIIFAITCIIFLPFLTGHYATDTYNIINREYKEYAITYSLNDGRPVMCLISLFAEKINMPILGKIGIEKENKKSQEQNSGSTDFRKKIIEQIEENKK